MSRTIPWKAAVMFRWEESVCGANRYYTFYEVLWLIVLVTRDAHKLYVSILVVT